MLEIYDDYAKLCLKDIQIEKLFLEITSECNYKCLHCFNSCENGGKNTDYNVIEDIIKKSSEKKIEQIIISGGEPFLSDDLEKIIGLCIDYKFKTRIITNGSIINEEILKKCIVNNIELQLTLNGSSAQIDEKLRHRGSFRNSVLFMEKIKEMGGSKLLFVSTCICKQNINDIYNIIELVKKYTPQSHILSFVQKMGRATNNWKQLRVDLEKQLEILNHIARYENEDDLNITLSGMYFIKTLFGEVKKNMDIEKKVIEEIAIRFDSLIDFSEELNQYCDTEKERIYEKVKWSSDFFDKEHYIFLEET